MISNTTSFNENLLSFLVEVFDGFGSTVSKFIMQAPNDWEANMRGLEFINPAYDFHVSALELAS